MEGKFSSFYAFLRKDGLSFLPYLSQTEVVERKRERGQEKRLRRMSQDSATFRTDASGFDYFNSRASTHHHVPKPNPCHPVLPLPSTLTLTLILLRTLLLLPFYFFTQFS